MRFVDFTLSVGIAEAGRNTPHGRFATPTRYIRRVCGQSTLGLAIHGNAEELCRSASAGSWQVWCLGEVFTYTDQWAEPDTLPAHIADDLVGNRFRPDRLNGHFILLAHNATEKRWHLWTNVMGTYHAYYATNGGPVFAGSFFGSIPSNGTIDWDAVSVFLTYGYFPDERTYFDDVSFLRPGSHYVFTEGGQLERQERYWQWRYRPDTARSYDDTVDELCSILHRVVHEYTRTGKVALPISGGLDSRSIVVPLANGKPHENGTAAPWAYSYGYGADSVETRIAARIAAARHLPFSGFEVPPYLLDRLESVVQATEGYGDVTQCRQVGIAETLQAHADYVLGAHMGDLWLDELGAPVNRNDEDESILHMLSKKSLRKGSDVLFEQMPETVTRERARALFEHTVRSYLHEQTEVDDPDFKAKIFKIDQYVCRMTNAGLRAYQLGAFPRLPFYDQRFIEFFCTVPRSYLPGRKLQIDFLKRFAPDLSRISWQARNADLYHHQYFNTWLLPKRAALKAIRLMSGRKVVQRNWEVQLMGADRAPKLRAYFRAPERPLHRYLPAEKIRSFTDTFYRKPDAENGYAMSMLLTLSAWMDAYLV